MTMSLRRFFTLTLVLVLLTGLVLFLFATPSNTRDWSPDQAVLPRVSVQGDIIRIENIRNFHYASTTSYLPQYYTRQFSLDEIVSVDFMVEPFGNMGAAHTLLSFGLQDGSYLAISVEIRKEIGETFSPLRGLLRRYELMYVIGDEHDLLDLRANHRKHPVYLYPVEASPEAVQKLFLDMLTRSSKLSETPEFYNTLTNNCIINIVRHITTLNLTEVPWDPTFIFPAHADAYAQELGLIAPDMTIEEAREKYRINERALEYQNDPEFSKRIRGL